MRLALDFDGTIVSQDHAFDDLTTTPTFVDPRVPEWLASLREAGHTLILWSGRANLAAREDWRLDPVRRDIAERSEVAGHGVPAWLSRYELHQARYQQMLSFVEERLPDAFDFIDDGRQGKVSADLYLDDRAVGTEMVGGIVAVWEWLVSTHGEPVAKPAPPTSAKR